MYYYIPEQKFPPSKGLAIGTAISSVMHKQRTKMKNLEFPIFSKLFVQKPYSLNFFLF
jgi:hypothetical protein